MADYFSSLGFTCPQHMSIADYCVDVSSIDPRTCVPYMQHVQAYACRAFIVMAR